MSSLADPAAACIRPSSKSRTASKQKRMPRVAVVPVSQVTDTWYVRWGRQSWRETDVESRVLNLMIHKWLAPVFVTPQSAASFLPGVFVNCEKFPQRQWLCNIMVLSLSKLSLCF